MLGAVPGPLLDPAKLQLRSSSTILCQDNVCQSCWSRCPAALEVPGPDLGPGRLHRLLTVSSLAGRWEGVRRAQLGRVPLTTHFRRPGGVCPRAGPSALTAVAVFGVVGAAPTSLAAPRRSWAV